MLASGERMRARWVICLALFTAIMFGQTDANKGSITGVVTDGTGAPLPDAKVLAIQTASGLERETVSGRDGQFRLGYLLPGSYEVRIEAGSMGAIVREV